MIRNFQDIVKEALACAPKRKILVPEPDGATLDVLSDASRLGLADPVLMGRRRRIEAALADASCPLPNVEIAGVEDPREMSSAAIQMLSEGLADMALQGALTQRDLISALADSGPQGRKNGLSYASLFEMPGEARLFMITDTYIHNFPALAEKKLIIEHGLALAGVLGIGAPKIAALAAIEQVNPQIPSTVDSAILSKMSERGQFGQAVIDGPIDIDCALSSAAAARKGLASPVTGKVDIYLVPDIESGYSFAQLLVFIGRMPVAGALLGTPFPVILDMPFVLPGNRITEIALASLMKEGSHERT
jgi:phosphotransacetylase